jgi:DNA repair ATPase RecN
MTTALPLDDMNTTNKQIQEILLDVREIKTLMNERKEAMQVNTKNLNEAFERIRELERGHKLFTEQLNEFKISLSQQSSVLDFQKKAIEDLLKSQQQLMDTTQHFRDNFIKLSFIGPFATAIIMAIILKFFMG